LRSLLKTIPLLASVFAIGEPAFATRIDDPAAFVRDVYRRLAASAHYQPPTDIYTPRLKALFDEDRRRAKGEVGCIDFVFWTNGQDSNLRDVRVTSQAAGRPDRALVTATFIHERRQEIQLDFQKIGGRWLLDDACSLAGETWILSKLLKCW
jgi:hypothetical protein